MSLNRDDRDFLRAMRITPEALPQPKPVPPSECQAPDPRDMDIEDAIAVAYYKQKADFWYSAVGLWVRSTRSWKQRFWFMALSAALGWGFFLWLFFAGVRP